MIIPDNDVKTSKSKKIVYIISLTFMLIIVFILGYMFRDNIGFKCKTCNNKEVEKHYNDDFLITSLYKDFEEMSIDFGENNVLNVKREKDTDGSIIYVQDKKVLNLYGEKEIYNMIMVSDYFIIPVIDSSSVEFYIFDMDGNLIKSISEENGYTFNKYTYKDGKIIVDASKKYTDICSIGNYEDEVISLQYEFLYLRDKNFIFRSIDSSKKRLSELINEAC